MFPKGIKEGYGNTVNLVSYCGGFPFIWSSNYNQLMPLRSRVKWFISVGLWIAYMSFLIVRTIQSVLLYRPLRDYNLLLFLVLAVGFAILFYALLIFRAQDLVRMVNSSLKFIEDFHG
jgi:hypothetical protein